jgi:hypothetical protein
MSVSHLLIGLVLIILLVGITWAWLSRLSLGRLPGDIVVERENFHFYLPPATSKGLGSFEVDDGAARQRTI